VSHNPQTAIRIKVTANKLFARLTGDFFNSRIVENSKKIKSKKSEKDKSHIFDG
jgi:hypothetical protein